jgi:hypothetical protein
VVGRQRGGGVRVDAGGDRGRGQLCETLVGVGVWRPLCRVLVTAPWPAWIADRASSVAGAELKLGFGAAN